MRTWGRVVVIAGAVIAACQFHPHEGPADGGIDASLPLPDAGPCQTVSTSCPNADVLRTCATVGGSAVDTACHWGCRSDNGPAHCAALSPSGGYAMPGDTTGSDVGSATLDNASINQTTGAITGNGATRNAGTGVDNGIDFEMRSGVGVFRFADLTITGTLKFAGSGPVVLVSTGSITVAGTINGQGTCVGAGGGPGGFAAGIGHTTASGSGGGGAGTDPTLGAGGGGYGSAGGAGGNAGAGTTVAGGTAFGDPITTLVGGGGGGGGNGGNPFGGGGGGAIQLVANDSLTIASTGSINAGGCGGTSGTAATDTGGGGGAGGLILLEAHDITQSGWLAVNGGGGGGNYFTAACNTSTARGTNGALSRTPAAGAVGCAANGGDGGAGSMLAGAPGAAHPYMGTGNYASGGGGAIGRIRFATRSGTATVDNSKLSPALTDSPTTCTEGSASTQ